MTQAPKIFISYSHDSEIHKEWVLQLAKDLRGNGVDALLDLWDLQPGMDTVRFMETGITDADRVIIVSSDTYVEKTKSRQGGVAFEGLIITGELVANVDSKKFIPILRNSSSGALPTYLGPRFHIDFRADDEYRSRLESLVREIHQLPALEKPPLGPTPSVALQTPVRPSLHLSPGEPGNHIFEAPWFVRHRSIARKGLSKAGLPGCMEIGFALSAPISKRLSDLLSAAHRAVIHTFGWPLGVILSNREEFRPRPTQDGLEAEISIDGRSSYDYWAFRVSGEYYLLNSLFEDERSPNKLFVDTRILRTTEAFLLCDGLYRNLGLADDATVGIQIVHRGLKGRTMTMANPNRMLFAETTMEDVSESVLVMHLSDVRAKLVDNVIEVLEPLFMLFNFKEFNRSIYEQLVTNYAAGRVV